jgi:hypothetical protein
MIPEPPQPGHVTLDGETVYRHLAVAFESAASRCAAEVHTRFLTFAGRTARLTIVGRSMAECLMRPFAHLQVSEAPGREPELEIDLWEGASTGVGCAGCEPWPDPAMRAAIGRSADGRWLSRRKAQSWIALDRHEQRIVGWIGDSRRLTQYELGRPLHSQLLLWHMDRGVQALHGGLVARNGHGVLLAGPGGSGKSTVALTCLLAGFSYLADDYVGLEPVDGGERYVGHSLYSSTHLEPEHLRLFPSLMGAAIPGKPPREDKSLIFLAQVPAARLDSSTAITALALPRVVHDETTKWRRAAKIDAVLRLAPSSMMMIPHAAIAAGLHELSRLVERVPAYWLDLGRNLSEIPRRVEDLLAQAAASAAG